jgi:hypothetical protein
MKIDLKKIASRASKRFTHQEMKESCKDIVIPRFFFLYLPQIIEQQEELSDDLKSHWSKLLSDVQGNEGQLSEIILSAFGMYKGKNRDYINLNTDTIVLKDRTKCAVRKDCVMIWTGCKTKVELNRLGELMRRLLGRQYHIEVVHSENISNKKLEDHLNKKLIPRLKKEGKRLIILTKFMGARSFSVSEVETEFLWYDNGGIESTAQRVARVLTPGRLWNGEQKRFGNIVSFSFDPNRTESAPIDDYLLSESKRIENSELTQSTELVLRSAYLFRQDERGLIMEFTEDIKGDYTNRLINSTSLLRVAEEAVDATLVMNDPYIDSIILKDDQSEYQESIDRSKVKVSDKLPKEKTGGKQNTNDKRTDYIKRKELLQSVVRNIPELSAINSLEDDDVEEMLSSLIRKGYDSEVVSEIGVGCKTIQRWIRIGALPLKDLNTILTQYNNFETKQ